MTNDDENAKNKDFKTPMSMQGVGAHAYNITTNTGSGSQRSDPNDSSQCTADPSGSLEKVSDATKKLAHQSGKSG